MKNDCHFSFFYFIILIDNEDDIMKKRIFIFVLFFTIVLLFSNISISTSAKIKDDEDLGFIEGAKSGILMELSTGEILYKKDIDKRLAPASMTKIMTLLLIFEGIENNVISYDTRLTVSKSAQSMGGSQVYLKENEKISVDEAIRSPNISKAALSSASPPTVRLILSRTVKPDSLRWF